MADHIEPKRAPGRPRKVQDQSATGGAGGDPPRKHSLRPTTASQYDEDDDLDDIEELERPSRNIRRRLSNQQEQHEPPIQRAMHRTLQQRFNTPQQPHSMMPAVRELQQRAATMRTHMGAFLNALDTAVDELSQMAAATMAQAIETAVHNALNQRASNNIDTTFPLRNPPPPPPTDDQNQEN